MKSGESDRVEVDAASSAFSSEMVEMALADDFDLFLAA